MEHELSATYDITHGLGLAILTPRWLQYCLDETRLSRYVQFAVNVFGVNPELDPMEIAQEGIKRLSDWFFKDLGLTVVAFFKNFGIGVKDTHKGKAVPIMPSRHAVTTQYPKGNTTYGKKLCDQGKYLPNQNPTGA